MKPLTKKVLYSIPIIFILGSLFHFAYEFFNGFFLIGIIAPVNESVFEHLKIIFYPILFWFIYQYIYSKNVKTKPAFYNSYNLAVSCFSSCFLSCIFMICLYYSYTGMFGIESVIIDIIIFAIVVFISQLLALHIYNRAKSNKLLAVISIIAICLIIAIFTYWTFAPPNIPFFIAP